MKKVLQNKYIQWILILIIGISIGAICYPSKSIRIDEQQKYQRQLEKKQQEHVKQVKDMVDKFDATQTSMKTKIEESNRKVHSLTQENHELRKKTDEGTLKIVKPDGTIIEKTYKKTETEQISQITTEITEEFNRKVKSIENKWMTIHKQRVSKIKQEFDKQIKEKEQVISEFKRKKSVEINKRSFGIAVGYLTNNNYYTSISRDVFGPVFIDVKTESNFANNFAVGGGIGLRF